MMRLTNNVLWGLVVIAPTLTIADGADSNVLTYAHKCFVADVIASTLTHGASLDSSQIPCRGAELVLRLLRNSYSVAADKEIVGLGRFRLDGEVAETYYCLVLSRGNRLVEPLRTLSATAERLQCEQDVASYVEEFRVAQAAFSLDNVCASAAKIASRTKNLLQGIASKRRCDPQDE